MIIRQNIAFDLDGTLVEIRPLLCQKIYERTGAQVLNNGKFHIQTNPKLAPEEISDAFEACFKDVDNIPIVPGATSLLRDLFCLSEGDPPTIITARPPSSANYTYDLMERIVGDIPFKLILCGQGDKKHHYLRGIDFFVDDRRHLAVDLALNHKKCVFIPRQTWNHIKVAVPNVAIIESVASLSDNVRDFLKVDVHYA